MKPAAVSWETLSKLVVPASVVCYVTGFLVAVPHFAKCGVSVDVISPQTSLAAAMLFLVLTIPSYLSGVVGLEQIVDHSLSLRIVEVVIKTASGKLSVKLLAYRRNGETALDGLDGTEGRIVLTEDEISLIHKVIAMVPASEVKHR